MKAEAQHVCIFDKISDTIRELGNELKKCYDARLVWAGGPMLYNISNGCCLFYLSQTKDSVNVMFSSLSLNGSMK